MAPFFSWFLPIHGDSLSLTGSLYIYISLSFSLLDLSTCGLCTFLESFSMLLFLFHVVIPFSLIFKEDNVGFFNWDSLRVPSWCVSCMNIYKPLYISHGQTWSIWEEIIQDESSKKHDSLEVIIVATIHLYFTSLPVTRIQYHSPLSFS